MASVTTDMIHGVETNKAVKVPCRVATTSNITLEGLQSIDGVTVAAGDRVLVWQQTNGIYNGIWDAAEGLWSRAEDFNGRRDATTGTLVLVTDGSTYADHEFQFVTTGAVTFGATILTFLDMANIGAGALFLRKDQNLADLPNSTTARGNLDLPSTTTAGRYWRSTADGAEERTVGQVRSDISASVFVANRTALKALSTAQDKAANIYNEGGRNGLFTFNSADLSALVTADTQEGIYIAPASDATGASGAWVRVYEGTLYPWWFGAIGDNDTDDATALQAWLSFGYSTAIMGDYAVMDGGGRPYRTDTTLAVTGAVHERELCNILIRAGDAGASPILDFSGVTSITRCTFRNCNINAWGIGDSCILLDNTQGVVLHNCEITCGTTGYGIKDLNTAAACEVNIDHCLISGPASANTCTGIWFAGHDSKIRNSTVRYCNPCIRLDGDAYLVLGNHLYSFEATNTAEHDVGIYLKGSTSGNAVISGNYIDNVSLFAESLNLVTCTGNYWLTQANGVTPAWVIFKPLAASTGIVGFICTGNVFKGTVTTVKSFKIDTTSGTLDTASVFEVIIKDNTFFGVDFMSSHPKKAVTVTASTSGNSDFTSVLPFGAVVRAIESSALVRATGVGGPAYDLSISGNVVFVTAASSFTGKVIVRISICNDDTKP